MNANAPINSFWRRLQPSCRPKWIMRLRHQRPPPDVAPGLAIGCASLRESGGALEKQFLNLGALLEQLPPASAEMVRVCDRILGRRAGDSTASHPIEATVQFLRGSTEYLEGYQARILEVTQRLRGVVTRIDELLRTEDELRQTVAPMKYVRTLLKIELSRLDASLQSTFVTLADEIATMEGKLGETFETRFGNLRAKRTIAAELLGQLEARLARQSVLLSARKMRIDESGVSFGEPAGENSSANQRMAEVSHSIDRSVSELVVGMQVQDIVGQKLGHVVEAIEGLRHQWSEAGKNSGDRDMLARTMRSVGRVQAAQLDAIRNNLQQTEQSLATALEQVGEQARDLETDCRRSMMRSGDACPLSSALETLLDASRDVRELLSATVEDAERACEGFRPISSEAATVTVTIRDVSIQMRLIALNMQVQAALFGGRTGIEIIAGQTATIAAQTDALGQRVAADMDLLSTGLADMLRACEALRQEGRQQHVALTSAGLEREADMHALRDQGLKDLLAAAIKVSALTGGMRQWIRLEATAGSAVASARATLESMVAWCDTVADRESDPAAEAEAEAALSRTYTMEAERAVHAAALGRSGVGLAPVAAATTGAAALGAVASGQSPDGLGDNVELF